MKDRIRNLLINGLKASEIANVVGCSPSYIAQLTKDDDFKKSVEIGMLAAQVDRTEEEHLEKRYETLEHKLITAAEGAMAEAKLGEIVRAIEVINKRSDMRAARKNPAPTGPTITMNVVSLGLPNHALSLDNRPAVTLNEKQEIIAIGGKALAPMSSDAVKNLFASAKTLQAAQQIEDASVIAEI